MRGHQGALTLGTFLGNALLTQTLLAAAPGLVFMSVIAAVTTTWHVVRRVATSGTAYLVVAWHPSRRSRICSLAAATDTIAS